MNIHDEPKETIALLVMTKNRLALLKRCIQSAIRYVDHVYVVDTGSSDGSIEWCESLPAITLLQMQWHDRYDEPLNLALDQIREDWVFRLDSDEFLLPQSAQCLVPVTRHSAQYLTSQYHFDGEYLFSIRSARLFKPAAGIRYRGIVHEELFSENADWPIEWHTLPDSGINIHHQLSRKDIANRRHYYRDLAQSQYETDPTDLRASAIYAHCEYYLNPDAAKPIIQRLRISICRQSTSLPISSLTRWLILVSLYELPDREVNSALGVFLLNKLLSEYTWNGLIAYHVGRHLRRCGQLYSALVVLRWTRLIVSLGRDNLHSPYDPDELLLRITDDLSRISKISGTGSIRGGPRWQQVKLRLTENIRFMRSATNSKQFAPFSQSAQSEPAIIP